jgi:hypothetical protein
MEEMSKKTKRLEKENLALSRKHEVTNANIIKMAEERNRTHKELDLLRKKNENLEKLCRGMQAQGRGLILPREHPAEAGQVDLDDEGTESEYDDYDDEDVSLDEDYDEDSEEIEVQHRAREAAKRVQLPASTMATNGAVAGAQRAIPATNSNGVVA